MSTACGGGNLARSQMPLGQGRLRKTIWLPSLKQYCQTDCMDAVLLARASDIEVKADSFFLPRIKAVLRKFSQSNGLNIVKEIEAVETMPLSESPSLHEALDFVEKQNEKTALLYYQPQPFNCGGTTGARWLELQKAQKIEFKNHGHYCFKEPSRGDAKIWRYLSLPKFLDLIQSRQLYFARADSLREMDRQEGVYHTDFSKNLLAKLSAGEMSLPEDFGIAKEAYLKLQQQVNDYNENFEIRNVFVNCWHISDFENFAMWKIYSEQYGVGIQTTFQTLYESFGDDKWNFFNEKCRVYLGQVIYIDKQSTAIPEGNMFWPYMHKRVEFEFERELRCVVSHMGYEDRGVRVNVDVTRLTHAIHVSPFAPSWFKSVVEDACHKYGIDAGRVRQSILT